MNSGFSAPFGTHPKMQAAVEQLAGEGKLKGGGGSMNIRWPTRGMDAEAEAAAVEAWRAPGQGHVDGCARLFFPLGGCGGSIELGC